MADKIIINDVEYDVDKLTDEVKKQITNLQHCDQEILRTQNLLAYLQTARAAYARALDSELNK